MKSETAAALLIEKIARTMYRDRAPGDTQPLQWSILRALHRAEPQDRTVAWIARYLGLTHAPVSRAVSTLVDRGLVRAAPGRHGGRARRLELTEAGRHKLQEDPIRDVALLLREVEAREFEALTRALTTVAMALETRDN